MAIDELGEESVASNVVEGMPICPEVDQDKQVGNTAPSAGIDIQNMWIPFLIAFFAGLAVLGFVRKKE